MTYDESPDYSTACPNNWSQRSRNPTEVDIIHDFTGSQRKKLTKIRFYLKTGAEKTPKTRSWHWLAENTLTQVQTKMDLTELKKTCINNWIHSGIKYIILNLNTLIKHRQWCKLNTGTEGAKRLLRVQWFAFPSLYNKPCTYAAACNYCIYEQQRNSVCGFLSTCWCRLGASRSPRSSASALFNSVVTSRSHRAE